MRRTRSDNRTRLASDRRTGVRRPARSVIVIVIVLMLVATSIGLSAQAETPGAPATVHVFTLEEAIRYALDHYPAIRVALEQVHGSRAGIDVARAAYLPRLDAMWQSSRATVNNVIGQVLPQSVVPAMSGPVLPSASSQNVWGTATGALFSWEPLDFGLRKETVAGAEAGLAQARAGEMLTRLDVQSAVAAAFLGLATGQVAIAAAQADVDRRDALARAVQTLVDNQLRPGAEASRSDAERAAARTRLIQTQQAVTLAQITFARVLGLPGGSVAIDATSLGDRLPPDAPPGATPIHPLVGVRQAAMDAARAQEAILSRTDLPRVYLQSSVFARGSGVEPSTQLEGGFSGLDLDRANWAAGVQVVFPNAFDFAALRARKAAAAAATRADAALYDETLLAVTSQQQTAAAMVQTARAIAANTPVQLSAAQRTETQARARYDAGLASIVEVADAQSLLAQAEAQDRAAKIDVWRALLAQAMAHGTVEPFLSLLDPARGAR